MLVAASALPLPPLDTNVAVSAPVATSTAAAMDRRAARESVNENRFFLRLMRGSPPYATGRFGLGPTPPGTGRHPAGGQRSEGSSSIGKNLAGGCPPSRTPHREDRFGSPSGTA